MDLEKKYGKSGANNTCTEDDVKDDYGLVKDCEFPQKANIFKFEINLRVRLVLQICCLIQHWDTFKT